MNGLSCGEESMTCSAISIQYQRVTDGQTDRQTDVQPIAITCFSIADARKKKKKTHTKLRHKNANLGTLKNERTVLRATEKYNRQDR